MGQPTALAHRLAACTPPHHHHRPPPPPPTHPPPRTAPWLQVICQGAAVLPHTRLRAALLLVLRWAPPAAGVARCAAASRRRCRLPLHSGGMVHSLWIVCTERLSWCSVTPTLPASSTWPFGCRCNAASCRGRRGTVVQCTRFTTPPLLLKLTAACSARRRRVPVL